MSNYTLSIFVQSIFATHLSSFNYINIVCLMLTDRRACTTLVKLVKTTLTVTFYTMRSPYFRYTRDSMSFITGRFHSELQLNDLSFKVGYIWFSFDHNIEHITHNTWENINQLTIRTTVVFPLIRCVPIQLILTIRHDMKLTFRNKESYSLN